VVTNDRLQRIQQRFAALTMIVPFLGTIAAIVLWTVRPLGAADIGLLVVMYFLTSLGVTVGFHRHFSHRSFQARPALRAALGILGSMSAQGTLVYWAATHRRHHQFSEQAFDPHSPYVDEEGRPIGRLRGFWHSHLGWMLESRMTNTVQIRAGSDPGSPDIEDQRLVHGVGGSRFCGACADWRRSDRIVDGRAYRLAVGRIRADVSGPPRDVDQRICRPHVRDNTVRDGGSQHQQLPACRAESRRGLAQ
jgi:hypothetical protein